MYSQSQNITKSNILFTNSKCLLNQMFNTQRLLNNKLKKKTKIDFKLCLSGILNSNGAY